MKKIVKIILILLVIAIAAFNVWYWFLRNNNSSKKEEYVELSKDLVPLSNDLSSIGEKLYNNKDYLEFEKQNNMYFISLDDLKEKYNEDISKYKVGDIECDTSLSGIYFDVDRKNTNKNQSLIIPALIGCEEDPPMEKEEELENKLSDNKYVVEFDSFTTGIFEHDGTDITKYYEYLKDESLNLEKVKNKYNDEFIEEVTTEEDHFVIKYKLEYVSDFYGSNKLEDIIDYFE